jgi:hypothetical protein
MHGQRDLLTGKIRMEKGNLKERSPPESNMLMKMEVE